MRNQTGCEKPKRGIALLDLIRNKHRLRWLFVIAIIVIGCQNYYKAVSVDSGEEQLAEFRDSAKYVVLHIDKGVFHLTEVVVDLNGQAISGIAEPLDKQHQYYLKTKPEGKPKSFSQRRGDPLVEVHVYGQTYEHVSGNRVVLPLTGITKVEEYVFDEKATKRSKVFGIVGSVVGVLAFITLALFAPIMGGYMCPEIYVSNGDEFLLAGELYAGAIHAPMERDDYLQLSSLQAVAGFYTVRIAGREKETDRTNLAELKLVEHGEPIKVAFDQTGQAHSIAEPRSPDAAINSRGQELLSAVTKQDSAYALFDDDARPDKSVASIDLRFARPAGTRDGKLLIRGRSSMWQGYVYEKFIEQFGSGYHAYAEAQAGKSAMDHYTWLRDQGLSLSVYVETKDGWILQEAIPPTGAGADRDIVVPIDLSDVPGDVINVRLICAFLAWQVDHVAMDFTPDEKMRVITIPPFTARDDKGEDVTHLITATDDRYLVQADSGSVVTVTYLAPPMRNDRTYTAFLHGRGYYTLQRDYAHKPNPGFTRQFERDGQFSKFSKELYEDLLEDYSVSTDQCGTTKP